MNKLIITPSEISGDYFGIELAKCEHPKKRLLMSFTIDVEGKEATVSFKVIHNNHIVCAVSTPYLAIRKYNAII